MNYQEFSGDKNVKKFVYWIGPWLKEGVFEYSYIDRKTRKEYRFNSIFSAFEKYDWKKRAFNDNKKTLADFTKNMNDGLNKNDCKLVKETCRKILDWGGVTRGNINRINNNRDIIGDLNNVKKLLIIEKCENTGYSNIHCSSGFSKIYSMIIKDFIIYDSRVSSALCLFIRLFAEEKKLKEIPDILRLAFNEGRHNQNRNRNPNRGNYLFNNLYPHNYLKYNIIASWLLKLIIKGTKSEFNDLQENIQSRALESAMFMIGYEIKEPERTN